ncbi:unnamed protein product [Microthlaspi erraticum]|uniref:Uncharacterized protein n=1 Tax=Microthlaspi erraticum TaxID=1685480 RepID=A0A6D2IUC2_9BRAS|nr:unnamed protein product [Microthlaspi erraticum]
MKLIQDVMANREKVSQLLEMSTHQINLLTSPTFLPKVKDQGKFTLPCKLSHIELDNDLVDLVQVLPNSLDLCKCTDRGSMGIEHKDWLLSTL